MKKNTLKTWKVFGFIIFVIWTLTAVALVFWQGAQPFLFSGETLKKIQSVVSKKEKARVLDGVYLKEGETEKYPVAVMIDNHYEARPWSGLSFANLVFEAPVEGGITRFMAIYTTDKKIEKIGPVRSVRPYYIDWAMEFGAILGHVGGSPAALAKINSDLEIASLDLNQFYNGNYYWRSTDRFAPHNVYTSSEKLESVRENKNKSVLSFDSWKFKDDAYESERGAAKTISIDFSIYSGYDAAWDYDKTKNIYLRKAKSSYAKDSDGSLIIAKNIAVLETDITVIDNVSRREITTTGGGKAIVFQDGEKKEGTWEKDSAEDRLKFYDSDGAEIKFNRGTTWVEVVDDLTKMTESGKQ